MSQPKISRLERGIGAVDPDDVALMARARRGRRRDRSARGAGGALPKSCRQLASQCQPAGEQTTRPRALGGRSSHVQILSNRRRRGPAPDSEYARAVLTAFQSLYTPGTDVSASGAVPEAVSARVRRQEFLADRGKTFHVVLPRAIIPAGTRWQVPPIHNFLLLDDHTVTVDLYNNGFTSRSAADAAFYGKVFESFKRQATTEIDEILDRYLERYLDLARPRKRA